jgi:hypothetical protein
VTEYLASAPVIGLLISWLAMHNDPNRLVRVPGVMDPH